MKATRLASGLKRGVRTRSAPLVRVGAVLIHNRHPLDPVGRRPALGDVDDPAVEVADLAGDPLVGRIGDLVRHAPPVLGRGRQPQPAHLDPGEHVPQPELDRQIAALLAAFDRAGDERLGIDLAPVGELRQAAQLRGRLDEGASVDRPEQPRALEVGADHVGDLAAALLRRGRRAVELADRDRQRLDDALRDVELEHGARRPWQQNQARQGHA
jgi:hypothetical protein